MVHSYLSTSCRSTSSSTTRHPQQPIPLLLWTSPPTTFNLSLAFLANSNPCTRLKKGSWRSFSRAHNFTPNLHPVREPLILCPPKPSWSTPSTYTISLHLSSPCSRNDPFFRNATATSHLSSLSHSDITAWTGGSVLGRLGQGGAGIHI